MTNPMMRRARNQQPVTTVKDAFQQPTDDRKRLVARVNTELHNQFKAIAAAQNQSITDVLEALITDYINKHRS